MTIGVFDSGRGGELLAAEIQRAFPETQVITELDTKNVPYGLKTPDEIHELTKAGIERLIAGGAEIVVLACNTASTIVNLLRTEFTVPIIALEPMIKPAAELTRSGVVAVLATPATLASERYQRLKDEYAASITVLEPDCGWWSLMIQREQLDLTAINEILDEVLAAGADVIVLGCTHYHVLEKHIIEAAGDKSQVLQPSEAIIERIRNLTSA